VDTCQDQPTEKKGKRQKQKHNCRETERNIYISDSVGCNKLKYRNFDFLEVVHRKNATAKFILCRNGDHLGNIRLSYSDLDLNGSIDPNTEILDEKNYYPFGGQHAGYNTVVNGTYHPYGYNGKEEQDELDLEWIDYGARNYDKWLGRYFNVDRLSEAYYDLNPYQYTANNPVKFIDVNGDYIYIWENGTQYRYENGETQKQNEKGKWINHSAQEGSYVSQIAGALEAITGGDPNSFGSQFLGLFENDNVNVSLFENTSQGDHKGKNETDGTDIYTFSNQSGSIRTTGGSEKLNENFHITLGHELAHGLGNNLLSKGALSDTWIPADPNIGLKDPIKNSEVFASMYENMLRAEQGLELRTHYIGGTSDNRSRLIQKSKTKNPFGKVYNPTLSTLEIFNSLVRRPKAKSVNSIKPAGRQ
jgi:RHS repeat-associated protein